MPDKEFSDKAVMAAVNAQSSEHLKWSVQRSGRQFKIKRVPEWGESPVVYELCDDQQEAYANMERLRTIWAMRAALKAALEVE